jgi:hypothetical protein
VDVGVPFGLVDNPKYDRNYKGVHEKKMITLPVTAVTRQSERRPNVIFNSSPDRFSVLITLTMKYTFLLAF